jgi:hypothetical protein
MSEFPNLRKCNFSKRTLRQSVMLTICLVHGAARTYSPSQSRNVLTEPVFEVEPHFTRLSTGFGILELTRMLNFDESEPAYGEKIPRNGVCDAAFNSEARRFHQAALSFRSVSVITNALRLRHVKL